MSLRRLKQLHASGAGDGQYAVWNEAGNFWEPCGWYEYTDATGVSSTTLTSWVERLKLTTSANMPAGDYMLSWSFHFASSAVSGDVIYRIQIDDTTTVQTYEVEAIGISAFHRTYKSGTKIIAFTAGSHTIDIDFSVITFGLTAYCGYPVLSLRWVAK